MSASTNRVFHILQEVGAESKMFDYGPLTLAHEQLTPKVQNQLS